MDESGLKCTICSQLYSDDRVPKNLGCGHSICAQCIEKFFNYNKTCPECHEKISAKCASDLVVNYPLLRLTRALAAADTAKEQKHEETSDSCPRPIQDVQAGFCKDHNVQLSHRCMQCRKWLCIECRSVSHFGPLRDICRIVPISDSLVEMKKDFLSKSEAKLEIAKHIQSSREKEISTLEIASEQHKITAHSIETALENIEISFRNLELRLESQNQVAMGKLSEIQDMVDLLQQTGQNVDQARTNNEMLEAIEVANDVLESVEKCLVQEQHRPSPVLPKLLSQARYNLKGMLDAGKQIYATCEVDGRHRCAKVTTSDSILHLHVLEDGAHAVNSVCIPYKTVRQLVPRESPSLFLDVGLAGILRGRVYIRLFGDTARSRQTMILCSGEQGHSYKYSCFYQADRIGKPMEILRGGDYEKNNGTGGKNIVQGITSGGVYKTEIVAGLLVGWPADEQWHLGAFDIYLRKNPGRYDNSGHGIVTKGLDILRAISRHQPVKDSIIQDCGLVIHL